MDFEVTVDLDDVRQFIESEKFSQFLLANTTEFTTAAFILQTLLDAVDAAATQVDNTEEI